MTDHSPEAQREQEIRLGYKTTRHTVRGPLPPARPHLLHVLQLSQTVLVAKVHVFKHRSLLETFSIQTATVSQRFWMNTSSFKFLLPFFLCSSLSSFPLIFEFQKTQEFFFYIFFVYTCVSMPVYMYVHTCVPQHMSEGERIVLGVRSLKCEFEGLNPGCQAWHWLSFTDWATSLAQTCFLFQ